MSLTLRKEPYEDFPYCDINHKMTFGQYRGKRLGWIEERHPEYIVWLDNQNALKIDPSIVKRCADEIEEDMDLYPGWEDIH